MTTDFSFTEDIIDVRDLIEKYEELRDAKDAWVEQLQEWRDELKEQEELLANNTDDLDEIETEIASIKNKIIGWGEWHETDEGIEYIKYNAIIEELCGNGGDEQWEGDWYPVTLIHENYFTEYTKELVEDCGYIKREKGENSLPWWISIDWDDTADNVKVDYTSIDIENETYYYR